MIKRQMYGRAKLDLLPTNPALQLKINYVRSRNLCQSQISAVVDIRRRRFDRSSDRETGNAGVSYPRLSPSQAAQLLAVPAATDGMCEYRPCRVTTRHGEVHDRVYVVEAHSYLRVWGVDPSADPGKRSVAVDQVIKIEESPYRLSAPLADRLYRAGESGMGYVIFTVVMSDGTQLPFLTGNAVDFPAWPAGVNPQDAVDVLPHQGRQAATRESADYLWCLYQGGQTSTRR
jgi:hypothetical protein